MRDDYVPLDDHAPVTITLTRAQRRLMRNAFSAGVQDEIAREPSDPVYRDFHREHIVKLKAIVNLLFDEPEYKACVGLPVDAPHVHLPL